MQLYSYTHESLEDVCDQTKYCILTALVNDGTLTSDVADEWARTHTIILRSKGFFRTVFNRWWKETTVPNAHCFLVVKLVEPKHSGGLPEAKDSP